MEPKYPHTHIVEATITDVIRRQNTTSGNPRWSLQTSRGVYNTEPDAAPVYSITGNETGPHLLHVDSRTNRVVQIEPMR